MRLDLRAKEQAESMDGAKIVEEWKLECRRYHELSASNRPDLLKHFKDLGKWYP